MTSAAYCPAEDIPSSGVIKGYHFHDGAFELPLAPTTSETLLPPSQGQCSRSSRPIFEMLAGERDWDATAKLIASDYTSPLVGVDDPGILGLLILDLPQPREAYVVSLSSSEKVVPAVELRASGDSFDASPCVLFNNAFRALVVAHFRSASVSALLKLTRDAFRPVFQHPSQSADRLKALCATGTLFTPNLPNQRDWLTACNWRDWQLKRLSFDARVIALARLFNSPLRKEVDVTRASAALRQRCSRYLKLKTSDRSDT